MPPYAGPCVFLVDDDQSMRHALERILHLGGYAPMSFTSAEAFLETSNLPDAACMIFDVHLPGLTGFELYEKLSGTTPKPPPVIFITAYNEPESRDIAESLGAAGYFTKPFSGRDLVAAITSAVVTRAGVRSGNGASPAV